MNKTVYMGVCLAMLVSLNSCIKDNSTGASEISRISLTTPLQQRYTQNQWDVLSINPQITQTNNDKPLSYEWEINYKIVSTGKELSYVCSEPGNYVGRLKVTNGEDIQYYRFNVEIQFAYARGLYVLAQNQGKTILSYLPAEDTGKSFSLDVLSVNNPDMDLTKEPTAFEIAYNASNVPMMYIALGNPSTVYNLSANRLTTTLHKSYDDEIYWLASNPNSAPKHVWFVGRKAIESLTLGSTVYYPLNHTYNSVMKNGNKVELAKKIVPFHNPVRPNNHAMALFDNTEGHLLLTAMDASQRVPAEIFPGTFTGQKFIGMEVVEARHQLVLFTHNPTTNTVNYYHLSPGYYPTSVANPIVEAVMINSGTVNTATIDTDAAVVAALQKNVVYYSKGNKIFGHNILAATNFPTEPTFTLSNPNDKIVQMYISQDESKLFVAANAPSGDMQGSIYCYDLANNKLLWEKKQVTGKIHSMKYRIY